MNGSRKLFAVAICGTTLVVAGCGSTSSRSTTHAVSPTVPAQSANHYSRQITQSGRSVGPGTIVIRRLGSIHYGCSGANGIDAVLDPRGVLATETAYVEGAGHQHLRGGTIQPGTTGFAANAPAGGSELWHVIQSTEPETLDARIAITVGSGCAARWTAQVGVISHAGAWSPPHPWL
jgi:hypothetical protein